MLVNGISVRAISFPPRWRVFKAATRPCAGTPVGNDRVLFDVGTAFRRHSRWNARLSSRCAPMGVCRRCRGEKTRRGVCAASREFFERNASVKLRGEKNLILTIHVPMARASFVHPDYVRGLMPGGVTANDQGGSAPRRLGWRLPCGMMGRSVILHSPGRPSA